MMPRSLAATATTPGTSLVSVARRNTPSIWRDCAAPPCAAARRMTAPTEAVAVSAAVALRISRRGCRLMGITVPPSFVPPTRRSVLRQWRGDVGEGNLERGPDVDDGRLAGGECLLQCRLQPGRVFDPDTAAAPPPGDRGIGPIGELRG